MSTAVMAIVAAINNVMQPVIAMTNSTSGAKTGKNRPTKYTPAATIVAECTSALTGVGPSMASGNHTCSGNCADLPAAPAKTPRANQVTTDALRAPATAASCIAGMLNVPALA